jgi:hypothetical protein
MFDFRDLAAAFLARKGKSWWTELCELIIPIGPAVNAAQAAAATVEAHLTSDGADVVLSAAAAERVRITGGGVFIGTVYGAVPAPTLLELDGSYYVGGVPTNRDLKICIAAVDYNERYGFSVNNSQKLGYHAGGNTGTGTAGHVFYSDGAERLRIVEAGVSVTGDLTLAGNIKTSAGTVALLNDTATTVNFAGAATTLTIGADDNGAATIRNHVVQVGAAGNVAVSDPSRLVLAPDYCTDAPGTSQQCKLVLVSVGALATYGISVTSDSCMRFWAGSDAGTGPAYFAFHTDGTERLAIRETAVDFQTHIAAHVDNTYNIGSGSCRFKDVFIAGTIISTSDATEKQVRGGLTSAEIAVAQALSRNQVVFQWLAALETKGPAARLHMGWTAQQVRDTFLAHGLDARRYGLFCEDTVLEDAEESYEAEIAVVEQVDVTDFETVLVGGRAVRRARHRSEHRPVVDVYPVFDETGAPLMEPQIQADGRTAMAQATHAVPRTTMATRTRTVRQPALDADGQPRTRLGLRMDQVLAFVTAGLAATIAS